MKTGCLYVNAATFACWLRQNLNFSTATLFASTCKNLPLSLLLCHMQENILDIKFIVSLKIMLEDLNYW